MVDLAETAVAGTGVTVLPSDSLDSMHPPIGGHEAIGLVVALLVLFLTLGSLWAAGLPVLTALIGVGIGVGGAFALSSSITLTTATPALALMIGLAVGIDYALFILHRQRRLILTEGLSAGEATARALATAGSAVVFAGSTVVIALVGMTVIGIGFLTTMALVAASTVALAVLIALTLLPALLGILGERICSRQARARTRTVARPSKRRLTNRWVELLVRRPWFAVAGVVVIFGLAAIPAASMDLGMPSGGTAPHESTSRQSYDAITRGFGEGYNAPLLVVAQPEDGGTLDQATLGEIAAGLSGTDDVTSASLMGAAPDHSLAMFTVIPAYGPDDDRTAALVETLRDPAEPARHPDPGHVRGHRTDRGQHRHHRPPQRSAARVPHDHRRPLPAPAAARVPLGRHPDQGHRRLPAQHRGDVRCDDGGVPVGVVHRAGRPGHRRAAAQLPADHGDRHPLRAGHGLPGLPGQLHA